MRIHEKHVADIVVEHFLCLKDTEGVHEDSTSDESRAKKRLKLTTRLMQRIFSPLEINGNNTLADNECAIYSVAKRALGDACRLAMSSEREAGSANNFNAGNLYGSLSASILFFIFHFFLVHWF